jgi:hypothetical protein
MSHLCSSNALGTSVSAVGRESPLRSAVNAAAGRIDAAFLTEGPLGCLMGTATLIGVAISDSSHIKWFDNLDSRINVIILVNKSFSERPILFCPMYPDSFQLGLYSIRPIKDH